MHGSYGTGGGNVWLILGIVIAIGVLWLVFKSFGQKTPP